MKYLTKGDLLTVLGAEADAFTAFMVDPAAHGITEPLLTKVQLAKQKLDWVNGIDVDFPEIQQLLGLLNMLGVISEQAIARINSTNDDASLDSFTVNVIAQDDITLENQYGAEAHGSSYLIVADFKNNTSGAVMTEQFWYDRLPTEEDVTQSFSLHIKQLKKSRGS